ncbi:MAG: MFS transporter [Paracoccaceae bacterium]|nr:MFS transporter [Paracoccaceae bacterium]
MAFTRDIITSRGAAAAFAAVGLYWGAFAGLVPQLKAQVGLSDGAFGLALLVSSCGAIMAMWLAPRAEARMGTRATPILAVLLALAFLTPGLAWNGVSFALAMLAGAMASGTLDVVMNARVAALEAGTRRPLMNLNHGIFSVAYAASAISAGLAREAGLTPFTVFAGAGVVTLILCVQMWRAPIPDPDMADDVPAAPLSWMLLLPGGMIILIAFMAEQATEGWSALHLERNLAAGAAQGALGPAILGITMAVGRFSGQMVAMRFSEAAVIRAGAFTSAFGALLAAYAPNLAIAYIGFAVLGLGVSVMAPMAFAWVGRLVAPRHRSHAISRISVVGYTGFFIGPPMMGFLSQWFGLPVSFTAIALCLLIVPLLLVPALGRRAARA